MPTHVSRPATLCLLALATLAGCTRTPRTERTPPSLVAGDNANTANDFRTVPRAVTVARLSLDEIIAFAPQTRAQLHLVHLAQLHAALRGREDQFDDRSFDHVQTGLHAAMNAPTEADVRLATQLALAAPTVSSTILDALASFDGTGGAWDHGNLPPARRDAAERVIRGGPAEAVVWAVRSGFPGERHAASFAREQLGRLAESNACPVFNSIDRSSAERRFAGQPPAPCLSASPDPRRYAAMTTDALIDALERDDEAAARELRDRFTEAQNAQQGQSGRVPTVAQFGRIVRLDARRRFNGMDASSVPTQAFTSANNVPAWVEWLVANPRAVGQRSRSFAQMLVESAAGAQPTPAQRAALAIFRETGATALTPIERQWSMPNAEIATLEAAWRLAADVRDFYRIGGFYMELYRRSATDDAGVARAQLALAARNDAVIVQHLAACERAVAAELPRGEEQATWIEHAMASAVANECAPVASVQSILDVRRAREAIDGALQRSVTPWRVAIYLELTRLPGNVSVSVAARDALLANRRARAALLRADDGLWQHLPAAERTNDAAFMVAAQQSAEALLGAFPDQVAQQSVIARGESGGEERVFVVNSSETPTLPPISLRFGMVRPGTTLSPRLIARIMD